MPVAKFVFTNVCLNQPMNFIDSSKVASGSIAAWSWNFGDASALATIGNPSHTYASPGTYTVTLIVTTNNGCKDTTVKSVVVHPLPIAQFNTANVCNGTPVQFTDASTILATDTIQSWKWNFADGSAININQNSSHLYATAGSYAVELLIVSNFGCKDSITKTSIVHPNPVVDFTTDKKTGCEPLCVNFKDSSFVATGANAHWLWSFGDGSPASISQNILHCYSNDSVFSPIHLSVTLTVTSDSGCVTTKTKNNYITVYPDPVANFAVQPSTASIINPIISITDLSTGTNFWHWNFGSSAPLPIGYDTTSIHNPPPHTYADTGTYVITLITSTLYACVDTAYQKIYIEPDFLFYIPNAFTPNDDGVNDTFTGKGIFIKDFEMSIYDRWGELIFFTDDISKPWDGTANHGTEIAQQDVYVYSIKVTDINNQKHSYKGIVTLVR
jgi:gliding motility-associated-like protein